VGLLEKRLRRATNQKNTPSKLNPLSFPRRGRYLLERDAETLGKKDLEKGGADRMGRKEQGKEPRSTRRLKDTIEKSPPLLGSVQR